MHYFVVDCRPLDHFSCGHLPDAYSLDANLVRAPPTQAGGCSLLPLLSNYICISLSTS